MRIKREKSLGITPDGRKISINISNYEVRFHDIKLKFNNFLLNYTKISRERGYTSMKSMPIRHLSARVPWHDGKWGGNVCMNAIDNSFCRILPNVDSKKDSDSSFFGRISRSRSLQMDKYHHALVRRVHLCLSMNLLATSYTHTRRLVTGCLKTSCQELISINPILLTRSLFYG